MPPFDGRLVVSQLLWHLVSPDVDKEHTYARLTTAFSL